MPTTRANRRYRLVRARPEAVPTSLRRMYRRLPHARSPRPWIYAGLAGVVLGALGWILFGTSLLGVRTVEVTGSELATPDQVRAAAGIVAGTPMARLDTGAVARRVGALPPVASVDVRRSWPHTVVIEVSERVPLATVAVDGRYGIVDAAGVVFRTVADRPSGLALIDVSAPGPDDPATRAALRVLQALTPELRGRLSVVRADSPTHVRVRLRGGREIVWGDAEQSETKARLATSLLSRPGRTIDVTAPDAVTVS